MDAMYQLGTWEGVSFQHEYRGLCNPSPLKLNTKLYEQYACCSNNRAYIFLLLLFIQHYPIEFVHWVGMEMSQILCELYFVYTGIFSMINSSEVVSLI